MDGVSSSVNVTSKVREVFVSLIFLKVGEIDTLQETFEADVYIKVRWRECTLDHGTNKSLDEASQSEMWNPKIQIQNIIGSPRTRLSTEVEFTSQREAYIIETRRIKGTFSEHLELHNFPFDVQDLSVLITTELTDNQVNLLEDEKELSRVNPRGFLDAQEWALRDHVEATQDVNLSHEIFATKKKYPTLTFTFIAFRRPGFFIWNIIFVMALISSLSMTTFAIPFSGTEHRLQMTATLVLTGVAFKFTASQSLPKIPYLTYLDTHILGCMIILSGACVWHAVISLISPTSLALTLDRAAFGVLVTCLFLFHLLFGLVVYCKLRLKKTYYDKAEKLYHEKAEAMYPEVYTQKFRRKPLFNKNKRNKRIATGPI
ncbi:cys-loop ligand-gated ion channel isoform X1 [Patella vulgata]|uniref:cys-loop ligand-gated ion channel isoform X1 n=2 Tax=Patella vulgata TaxID=6465 RepID=UPI0021801AA4|nr:cys-loop ligand-gated ion channel isoform X1 [Patella vulgata]